MKPVTTALNRHDIQKLEEFWIKHEENKKKLKFRTFEVLSEYQETVDINADIKSPYTVGNTTERNATLLIEDKLYQNLKHIVQTVEAMYKDLDEDVKQIVHMRYWGDKNECYEWDEIAEALDYSRSKVLRKRNNLVDETAKRIGWV